MHRKIIRWPLLLKIAKTTKSTSSQEPLDIFGMEYQWNIGIQNCKNDKNLWRSFVTVIYSLFHVGPSATNRVSAITHKLLKQIW